MTALVRRQPELSSPSCPAERAVDGRPVKRAARVTRPVATHEHEPRLDHVPAASEIDVGEFAGASEREATDIGIGLLARAPRTRARRLSARVPGVE